MIEVAPKSQKKIGCLLLLNSLRFKDYQDPILGLVLEENYISLFPITVTKYLAHKEN